MEVFLEEVLQFFLVGGIYFLIGAFIGLPFGPVGILVVQTSLERGFISGLLVSLGAASADFSLALIMWLGVYELLAENQSIMIIILMVSSVIILVIGVIGLRIAIRSYKQYQTSRVRDVDQRSMPKVKHETPARIAFHAFLISITNPLNIIFFLSLSTFTANIFGNVEGIEESGRDSLSFGIPYLLGIGLGSLSMFGLSAWLASQGKRFLSLKAEIYAKLAGAILFIIFAFVIMIRSAINIFL
jgi:threonine/homoserine/homoserine lactone efflux protein